MCEERALPKPCTARSATGRRTPADIDSRSRHIDEEHAALQSGDMGRALRLSGSCHIEIARLADHGAIFGFITQLVAQSSLIIAVYWRRLCAPCGSHAHDALMHALSCRDGHRPKA